MADEANQNGDPMRQPKQIRCEIDELMDRIKAENVPERLLFLARRLQQELNRRD